MAHHFTVPLPPNSGYQYTRDNEFEQLLTAATSGDDEGPPTHFAELGQQVAEVRLWWSRSGV